jgi:hypothetical protein
MHRSRFCAVIIDCDTPDLEAAATFWSQAFGRPLDPAQPSSPIYRSLVMRDDEPQVMIQKVEHPSRAHLDVESTDVEAEVARLERLGATRVAKVKTWWVMEAPTGQRFCVVRKQTQRLEAEGNVWEE